ncbi:hypothetical protein [Abyssalbus ytuae]|uniref:Uncharacterized protein n=1 Tax=Abyssalbus ytuae TaxID=2926907 RepID=A0A9E6ZMC1_9FLAO|nr:hypothetical protein [Abyssalbus ytuae]UOB16940.1 hypothetical protein MQE35_14520 [Abyssalbus ytuae]
MKRIVLLLSLFSIFTLQAQNSLCDKAYSKASYALLHIQKALKADNFDHQMYYAERALEAFNETDEALQGCNCKKASNAAFEGIQNSKNAVSPDKWETGRFYCKKALEDARTLIDEISFCNESGFSSTYSSDEITTDISEISASVENDNVISEETQSIQQQQLTLEQQRQKLLEEQKKLEEQIRKQEELKQQMVQEREIELQNQLKLKASSEAAIQNLERALSNLFDNYNCTNVNLSDNNSYIRSNDVLYNENLKQTKLFYMNKTIEILNKALLQYQNCK